MKKQMTMKRQTTRKNEFGQKGRKIKMPIIKNSTALCLALMLVLTLAGCQAGGDAGDTVSAGGAAQTRYTTLEVGDLAPDFTAELADGSTFTLSEQKGKKVLLNFWATWCGPCVGEMPALEQLQEEFPDELVVVAVDCEETKAVVDAFVEENEYTFPIAYDEKGEITRMYPTEGVPYTLIIDEEGVIQQTFLGAADADEQYKEYKQALGFD